MDNHQTTPYSLKPYWVGFALSVILTGIPFALVMQSALEKTALVTIMVACAVVQIIVHVICFLHIDSSKRQLWNRMSLIFTVIIIAFLVGGTIWIMENAMLNMMPEIPPLTEQR